jgi:hypothetical protein
MRFRPQQGLTFQDGSNGEPATGEGGAMRYKLRPCAEHLAQPAPGQSAATSADPPAAGAAGLCWLWGLVELRLGQAEPDSAA